MTGRGRAAAGSLRAARWLAGGLGPASRWQSPPAVTPAPPRPVQGPPVHGAVPDPGNPGGWLWLGDDGTGRRYLIGADGTPNHDGVRETIRIPVPREFTDPLEAAAWTYGVDVDTYRALARRT